MTGPVPRAGDGSTAAQERATSIVELSLALAELTQDALRLEEEVVRRVAHLVGYATALWRKDDEGQIDLRAFYHPDPAVRDEMVELARGATHHSENGVLPHAWRLPSPLVLDADQLQQWRPLMQPAYQEYFSRHGMASLMIVPLRVGSRTVALLGSSRDHLPAHDDDAQTFLTQVSGIVAVALENERLHRQLRQQLGEQNRAHLAAHRAAVHDPLTGLPNRRLLLQHLGALAAREEQGVALLLLDLNDFKHINDSYGHSAGDAVLKEVADALKLLVEQHAGSQRVTLARLGGDEFAVVVPEPPGVVAAEELAQLIVSRVAVPLRSVPDDVVLHASVGVARGRAAEASRLLREADIAMYRAKRNGLGWTSWSPSVDAGAEVLLQEIAELRQALGRDELEVHYQPLVDVTHRRSALVAEALVRWRHPRRGLLAPDQFLPLVRQTTEMPRLTELVLRQVVADLRDWHRSGPVQVAVNVEAAVLSSPRFLPQLLQALGQHALPPAVLCLELTESELLTREGAALLREVRAAGISVAIDDFGTGYSSLAYLADLDLDRLKLDQSFVRRLQAGGRPRTLIGHLVRLVSELGFEVVAEGVETAEEAAALAALGVSWQQGFHFARPMPAGDLTRWHAGRAPGAGPVPDATS